MISDKLLHGPMWVPFVRFLYGEVGSVDVLSMPPDQQREMVRATLRFMDVNRQLQPIQSWKVGPGELRFRIDDHLILVRKKKNAQRVTEYTFFEVV